MSLERLVKVIGNAETLIEAPICDYPWKKEIATKNLPRSASAFSLVAELPMMTCRLGKIETKYVEHVTVNEFLFIQRLGRALLRLRVGQVEV